MLLSKEVDRRIYAMAQRQVKKETLSEEGCHNLVLREVNLTRLFANGDSFENILVSSRLCGSFVSVRVFDSGLFSAHKLVVVPRVFSWRSCLQQSSSGPRVRFCYIRDPNTSEMSRSIDSRVSGQSRCVACARRLSAALFSCVGFGIAADNDMKKAGGRGNSNPHSSRQTHTPYEAALAFQTRVQGRDLTDAEILKPSPSALDAAAVKRAWVAAFEVHEEAAARARRVARLDALLLWLPILVVFCIAGVGTYDERRAQEFGSSNVSSTAGTSTSTSPTDLNGLGDYEPLLPSENLADYFDAMLLFLTLVSGVLFLERLQAQENVRRGVVHAIAQEIWRFRTGSGPYDSWVLKQEKLEKGLEHTPGLDHGRDVFELAIARLWEVAVGQADDGHGGLKRPLPPICFNGLNNLAARSTGWGGHPLALREPRFRGFLADHVPNLSGADGSYGENLDDSGSSGDNGVARLREARRFVGRRLTAIATQLEDARKAQERRKWVVFSVALTLVLGSFVCVYFELSLHATIFALVGALLSLSPDASEVRLLREITSELAAVAKWWDGLSLPQQASRKNLNFILARTEFASGLLVDRDVSCLLKKTVEPIAVEKAGVASSDGAEADSQAIVPAASAEFNLSILASPESPEGANRCCGVANRTTSKERDVRSKHDTNDSHDAAVEKGDARTRQPSLATTTASAAVSSTASKEPSSACGKSNSKETTSSSVNQESFVTETVDPTSTVRRGVLMVRGNSDTSTISGQNPGEKRRVANVELSPSCIPGEDMPSPDSEKALKALNVPAENVDADLISAVPQLKPFLFVPEDEDLWLGMSDIMAALGVPEPEVAFELDERRWWRKDGETSDVLENVLTSSTFHAAGRVVDTLARVLEREQIPSCFLLSRPTDPANMLGRCVANGLRPGGSSLLGLFVVEDFLPTDEVGDDAKPNSANSADARAIFESRTVEVFPKDNFSKAIGVERRNIDSSISAGMTATDPAFGHRARQPTRGIPVSADRAGPLLDKITHTIVFPSDSKRRAFVNGFEMRYRLGCVVAGGRPARVLADSAVRCMRQNMPLLVLNGIGGVEAGTTTAADQKPDTLATNLVKMSEFHTRWFQREDQRQSAFNKLDDLAEEKLREAVDACNFPPMFRCLALNPPENFSWAMSLIVDVTEAAELSVEHLWDRIEPLLRFCIFDT